MISPSIELPILSVSGLTQSIKMLLEGQFKFVAVQGEVSNCKLQSSGHLYFSLKDANAQISAVMFKGDLSELAKLPKDGDQVTLKGSLNVYPPNGKYQVIVRTLEYSGLGKLLIQLEALKVKLKEKGYFDPARKKPLPKFPRTIGVVTSPTGAVIQDILHVLTRRAGKFHLILNPVKVQGEGSAQEIAQAIDFFNQHHLADVLIVGRGGGSLEDLWAFNEEIVADAIHRSSIPIVSAVGHETDFTIADFVADIRAPTPSAAAEMVVSETSQELQKLTQFKRGIQHALAHLFRLRKEELQRFKKRPEMLSPYPLFAPFIQHLDELKSGIDRAMQDKLIVGKQQIIGRKRELEALKPSNKIRFMQEKLAMLAKHLDQIWDKIDQHKRKQLIQLQEILRAIDPKNLLKKGYSLAFSEVSGNVITSVQSLSKGDKLKLLFADGDAKTIVDEVRKN
jgi:exodeoxyribonuclease VII large subunit